MVSIHHPLGSNWHPLESAGWYTTIMEVEETIAFEREIIVGDIHFSLP